MRIHDEEGVERKQDLDGILDHPHYKIEAPLGEGSWGTVYRARDCVRGGMVALKVLSPNATAREKMRHRELTPFEVLKNEGDLAACSHVVPRAFEIDSRGTPFIRMPVYNRFLNNILGDSESGNRNYVGYWLRGDETIECLEGIARGIAEMHNIIGRAHADIKPDNIAIDINGKALLNDLGSSTYASLDWAERPSRDNVGFFFTRAPECFKEGSHPTKASDVWSFGAIAYRMFTGKYPLEGELRAGKNLAEMTEGEIDSAIDTKFKTDFPSSYKRIGSFVRSCLYADSIYRPRSLTLADKLHKTANHSITREVFGAFKKFGTWTAVTTLIGGAVMGTTLLLTVSPPIEHPRQKVQGLLYLDTSPNQREQFVFEAEQIRDLPVPGYGMIIDGTTPYAKMSSPDRSIAYLVDCSAKTTLSGAADGSKTARDYMERTFDAYASESVKKEQIGLRYLRDAVCVDNAISQLKQINGQVDLEDVLVASRLGKEILDEAKRISNSNDFTKYVEAKSPNGNYIIPEEDKEFIITWLSYIHDNH